ncbi:MAG: ParB N-terminal domain-containing protein [Anaerohalosphaeraceae bacterium]|nr:ParB N-terminal domain-containing protein [Anaerohalosphaeraceae bacterium]
MRVQKTIIRIPVELLFAHPENPNRMSDANFKKLKRNIEQTQNYEPVIVRKHPDIKNAFEIINGHHRVKALKQLGNTFADCVEWDVDDDHARLLLSTLNRLSGKDELSAKISLIKNLSENRTASELAKLLPETKTAIEKLKDITKPVANFAKDSKAFLNTLVFFLDDEQIAIVENALEKVLPKEGLAAERNAKAITQIAKSYSSQRHRGS